MAQKTPATVPKPRIVDDRKGHYFQLEESGWVPKYTSKEVCVQILRLILYFTYYKMYVEYKQIKVIAFIQYIAI